MQCPSLSLIIFFILRFTLSDMRIATPTFFCLPFAWNIFFHPLTFSLYVSLGLKWVSCRQYIYGSYFCIHSASMCLSVGAFNPFTFKVQFSCLVVSDSLWPHGLQHTKPPCPSPIPGVYSNSFPLSRWCHPTISSSVIPFSSCFQSFPASGSFQRNQFFASGGQRTGVSASVLPMNILD